MSHFRPAMMLLMVAASLAGCGRGPEPKVRTGGNCLGLADDLKTLRAGDELPRVVQVLGVPDKAYRAYSPFGRAYDVLEYNVGGSACARAVLHIDEKLQVVFDSKGGYVGSGHEAYMKFRRATTLRVEPLVIDPVILKP